MPLQWLRQPHVILSRLVGLSTTVWLFRKVGCWARSLTRLGALLLRFARRGRLGRQLPDYGHLLQGALYPGNPPSLEAASTARSLAEEAAKQTSPEEAFRLLREAVLLCPPDPSIYLARAQTHLRWQRNVEALDDAELCVSLDGQCVQGWLAKGKAEQLLGRSADAAASFQAGLDLEPLNVELQSQLTAVRAEPPPNLIMQFKDLVFAARLGLENLFRTLEDPERVTDVYIESNAELLDAQVGLLAQTLHVNKVVLFDSPRLCDAYEQIVFACSQLITGAPAAFSKCLSNAPSVVEGMSLAMRLGWLVHHSIGKLAANALLSLACCPTADDQLRRSAVRQLLGGLLRWLLDARPESDREVEEVCGCSCSVPWKAAACFLERLFEPGRPQPWIREECEAWPDSVLLCQWLMLSVRDYHATPLGLVGLLQMSGVAASTMQSKAVVDFFIAPPPFLEEDLEPEDGEEEELLEDEVYEEPSHDHSEFMEEQVWEAARASGMPWWRAAQVSRQPHRMLRRQHARAAAVAVVTASEGGNAEAAANMGNLLPPPEEDMVPSWAEFHHELLQELASPAPRGTDESGKPELVTLFNFESKASLLAEHAVVRVVFPEVLAKVQVKCKDDDLTNEQLKRLACFAVPAAWNLHASALASQTQDFQGSEAAAASAPAHWQAVSTQRFRLFHERERENMAVGSEEYVGDKRKMGQVILMSRRSIRLSHRVHNWAQAVAAAEQAGASAVVVYNDLDGMEPFRMGLFGEKPPSIPAFMVSGRDGAALGLAAARDCDALIVRSVPLTSFPSSASSSSSSSSAQSLPRAAPWPLSGGRLLPDVAQAWSLLEALSAHGEPGAEEELGKLLLRMSVPEKRVWLTRRLVRHHRAQQAADSPEGDLADPPLAFVEGDRWLSPEKQLTALRQQMCEAIGIGSEDICGEFEVRFHGEQGVGSAVVREWMDLVAREAFLNPKNRILRSFDRRQTFWPDAAAPFCNDRWRMDYEILGRLVGLALWQSCTLDLPLHPHVCALLFGFPRSQLSTSLAEVDEDLERLKVRWLLSNPVDDLGFQMPFSDPLCSEDQLLRESAAASSSEEVHEDRRQTDEREAEQTEQESQQGQEQTAASLPELVRLDDRLPGQERAWSERPLLRVGAAEVALGEAEEGEIVTDDNKAAFAEALTEWRLFGSVDLQVQAMAKGLGKVLPEELRREMRSLLSPLEIAQLLSGLGGEVSVDDWEAHTSYTHGLNRESNVVNWFWEVVRAWAASPEDSCRLPQLLQFVTGSARVPVGGFSELVGFNGSKHAFTLAGGSHLSANALPMAHACICTLDIPPYQDFETCKTKMTQMLQMGRQHFDEAAGRGDGD
eukprot:TRINITY_DN5950_c0_g1_i2.p1 TRINITY_DN5950_c0_g1~~TRINITY_DN5950_c0_g1_i2.p1  ORF type:complete len:1347 (-),score=350.97 TRINITY_DN5950_c0_g1_i2:132-4172(-)